MLSSFRTYYGLDAILEEDFKELLFTGLDSDGKSYEVDLIFISLTLYSIWQGKLRMKMPSLPMLIINVDFLLDGILSKSNRLKNLAKINVNVWCRQRRERGGGGE